MEKIVLVFQKLTTLQGFNFGILGGSPGRLWMTTHVCKVMSSNPGAVYWMDTWTFFHIDLL